jgi:methylenetetrahydrofolate dehydrogenase (NADP+) / methenyltetrahydrofolate cyclohydrolase
MKLLDGKACSESILQELTDQTRELTAAGKRSPHLVAILVGENPASETYVASKQANCEKVGFRSTLIRYASDVTSEVLLAKLQELNQDPEVDGILVQLPLPKQLSETLVIETISPEKDVDGFHPVNIGRMSKNIPAFLPATPGGILQLLSRNDIETAGKHCVVLGRSNIVGMPMAILMARNTNPGNATVTICHSRTADLKAMTLQADILIAAVGKPLMVTADMVKSGAVVVDVGIHRVADDTKPKGYRIVGDVDFDAVAPIASAITPVPGGVGPMTIAQLLLNTMEAYLRK